MTTPNTPDGGTPSANNNQQQTPPAGSNSQTPVPDNGTFEGWLAAQDDTVKGLLNGHVSGLKTALTSERDARKDLEKQLRDMAGKAEKGSETQTQLTQMADRVSESDRRADFYEAAHTSGVSNLKLAYLVATQEELFDKRGNANFTELKQRYPELFGGTPKVAAGNAGTGTTNLPQKTSMNDFIRRSAGRP